MDLVERRKADKDILFSEIKIYTAFLWDSELYIKLSNNDKNNAAIGFRTFKDSYIDVCVFSLKDIVIPVDIVKIEYQRK